MRDDVLDDPRRPTSRATRSAATTTRCCARGSQKLADAHRRRGRPVRLSRVHRQRAGARSRARREGGPRLARQAHAAAHARSRLVLLPRRDLHRPAAADRRRPTADHCGTCTALHRRLPDAARSSRPTSSTRGAASPISRSSSTAAIPEALRPLIGNRVYGCDDCQLACPWNRFAQADARSGFRRGAPRPRRRRAGRRCSRGREAEFDARMRRQRDPPHRLRALAAQPRGRARQRAARSGRHRGAAARADDPSPLVREHVAWALGAARRRARLRRRYLARSAPLPCPAVESCECRASGVIEARTGADRRVERQEPRLRVAPGPRPCPTS